MPKRKPRVAKIPAVCQCGCGAQYMAQTKWQKFTKSCGAKIRLERYYAKKAAARAQAQAKPEVGIPVQPGVV